MREPLHRRRSIRLRGYDYTRAGWYFVTANAQNRRRAFGTLVNGRMALNDAGRMVQAVWDEIPAHYPGVATDAFVVMPDHVHGVVRLVGEDGQPRGAAPTISLPDVVHRFKTMTTKLYADGVHERGWPPFPGRLWQRNYYEAIVRDDAALANIRAYIRDNPANADVLRYGEPQFMAGDRVLLERPLTAFLASRGASGQAPVLARSWEGQPRGAEGQPRGAEGQPRGAARTVISGFLSEMERAVFGQCLADGTPMVQVLARGLPPVFPAPVQRAIRAGRLLVVTPFPPEDTRVSSAKAAWCNQYALSVAAEVLVGQVVPGGMLACLLADLPSDKPVILAGREPDEGAGVWR